MTAAYNPFEILNIPMLKRIAQHGSHFIVLQRFNWPGIAPGRGFMGTPYTDQFKAAQHVSHLSEKEGKVLNLSADAAKITDLINDPKYYLFLNTFRDPNWDNRILKHYQRNIISYLSARMPIRQTDQIDINLSLEYGRLKAVVTANGPEHTFDAYKMIK
ncbi:hypothetical protein [Dyadobacter sp. 22481]|uniref:hypothetical protein n=1 Tax=Dyadobacter sp. 22481 TaxID=3453926 RepID=UPI003F824219